MWTDEERKIFQYCLMDGSAKWADPLRIRRRLLQHTRGNIDDLWERWRIPQDSADYDQQAALTAEEAIVAAVRHAFELPQVDAESGTGCPDACCLRLMEAYLAWYEKKNPSTPTTPNPSSPMAFHPAGQPSTTSSGSASPLTSSDCGCSKPT